MKDGRLLADRGVKSVLSPFTMHELAGLMVTLLQISPASTSVMPVSSGSATLRRSLTGPNAGFEGAG